MAWDAASRTHCGGGKSGSPTQRDVTVSPSASICLTREKTSTVLEGLICDRSGLRGGCNGDDDDVTSLYNSKEYRNLRLRRLINDVVQGEEVVLRDKRGDGEKAALGRSVIAVVVASRRRENLYIIMMTDDGDGNGNE